MQSENFGGQYSELDANDGITGNAAASADPPLDDSEKLESDNPISTWVRLVLFTPTLPTYTHVFFIGHFNSESDSSTCKCGARGEHQFF